jgi:hypothetical protein
MMACAGKPVTPIRLVDKAGQAGGYSSRTKNVPGSNSDSSRPWNKTTSKAQPTGKENLIQSLAKLHETCQELTSKTMGQNHMN